MPDPSSMPGRLAMPRAMAVLFATAWSLGTLSASVARVDGGADPAGSAFFENRIRPLLAEHCYECHGPAKRKGGLRLDSVQAIEEGGEHGPVALAGDPSKSPMFVRVSSEDSKVRMPPEKVLSKRDVADLRRWIELGLPGPAPGPPPPDAGPRTTSPAQPHWAFQPVRRFQVPVGTETAGAINPIDAFVAARLAERGLAPNTEAGRRELLRRLYFDVIGLAPSIEDVRDFEMDPSPDAYERRVEQLLARPQYGERWARHWLDVVRFAQTTGYERDGEKPQSWRYRDYVIGALNRDVPYNRFVREQLAGDECEPVTEESLAATGFFRLGVWDDEPADKELAVYDEFDDYVTASGAAFMGLTLGCARCHEHKFDPISQREYYQLLAFFRNVRGYEAPKFSLDSSAFRPSAPEADVAAWRDKHGQRIREIETRMAAAKAAGTDPKSIEGELARLRDQAPPFEWVLAAREAGTNAPSTRVLSRGNPLAPRESVEPAFPAVLGGGTPVVHPRSGLFPSSGRRRALADWLVRPEHPLTPRVIVNRLWHHHFGRGLVRTTTDLGRAGAPPTHPELLDWLASELIEGGWSLKHVHRLILTSRTYRQSSSNSGNPAHRVDPSNELLWRQNLRRLEAEAIRDFVLQTSGRLHFRMGGRGFFPRLGGEVLAGASRPGLDWEIASPEEESRRSVYTFVKRTMLAPALQSFDYSTTDSPLGERPVTTVAPQSLHMLNDAFLKQQAEALASRIRSSVPEDPASFVIEAYRAVLAREASSPELLAGTSFLARQQQRSAKLVHRASFRPDVPDSLYNVYFSRLPATEFLRGPTRGWTNHRGLWSGDYEGIRTVDRQRGPFALSVSAVPADGRLVATIIPHRAVEFVGLLFRSGVSNDVQTGLELALDVRNQRIALRRHARSIEGLGERPWAIHPEEPLAVRIESHGPDINVWIGDQPQPVLAASDTQTSLVPLDNPRVGVRAWGAAVSFDGFRFEDLSGRVHDLCPPPSPEHLELASRRLGGEAFCLMLLNLNEAIYVE